MYHNHRQNKYRRTENWNFQVRAGTFEKQHKHIQEVPFRDLTIIRTGRQLRKKKAERVKGETKDHRFN